VPAILLVSEIAISKFNNSLLQNSKFCLFATAVALSALHLSLTWRLDGENPLIIGVLFWGNTLLLWRKQDKINLESDIFSSFLAPSLLP